MPRYHFRSVVGDDDPDHEGIVLDSIEKARTRAIHYAGDILMSYAADVEEQGGARVEVIDAAGRRLYTVRTTVTDDAREENGRG